MTETRETEKQWQVRMNKKVAAIVEAQLEAHEDHLGTEDTIKRIEEMIAKDPKPVNTAAVARKLFSDYDIENSFQAARVQPSLPWSDKAMLSLVTTARHVRVRAAGMKPIDRAARIALRRQQAEEEVRNAQVEIDLWEQYAGDERSLAEIQGWTPPSQRVEPQPQAPLDEPGEPFDKAAE
jgi:hypothetical protein